MQTCQIEKISREGLCGKPAFYTWKHKDGETLVCMSCGFTVAVNGGELVQLEKEQKPKSKFWWEDKD